MARKGRHPKRGGRTTPKGTRPQSRFSGHSDSPLRAVPDEPEIVGDVRAAIADGPLGVLGYASTLVEACTLRPLDRFQGRTEPRNDLDELLMSFAEMPFQPLHVVGAAMLPLIGDRVATEQYRARFDASNIVAAPSWLGTLGDPLVVGATAHTDLLPDGDQLIVGVTWPDGSSATAVTLIDHNLGTAVKDVFIVPETYESILAQHHQLLEDPDVTATELTLADARARLAEAIAHGEIMMPPLESETWPGSRPLLEWFLSLMPPGGTGHVRPDWSEHDRTALLDRFLASTHAAAVDASVAAVRELADPLVWYGCDYGPGDPLRWSPAAVEIVLADWYVRKMGFAIDDDLLALVPDVLAAFVGFAHDESGIPARRTDETLAAIAELTPDFVEQLDEPMPTPAERAAGLARLAAGLDPDDLDPDDFDDDETDVGFGYINDLDGVYTVGDLIAEFDELNPAATVRLISDYRRELIDAIGGDEAAAALDDAPLPDMAFDWAAAGDVDPAAIDEVLTRTDRACDALLDIEMRSICRHYLARVVEADPSLFVRSQRTDLIAAGLVWAAVRIQRIRYPGVGWDEPTQKQLAEVMGVRSSSLSQRARSIEATLRYATTVTSAGPWHSSRRRFWLESLQEIERWGAELRDSLSELTEELQGLMPPPEH